MEIINNQFSRCILFELACGAKKSNEGCAFDNVNPLKPELNPICYLLALLAHHFFHVSRISVKSLTFR